MCVRNQACQMKCFDIGIVSDLWCVNEFETAVIYHSSMIEDVDLFFHCNGFLRVVRSHKKKNCI